MKMSEKCRNSNNNNNNSDNPLTSRRTDGGNSNNNSDNPLTPRRIDRVKNKARSTCQSPGWSNS